MIKKTQNGFSIMELLVSIFILLLIGLAIFLFQRDVFSLHKIISGNLTIQFEARRALKSMTSEIRSTSPSNLGAYAIDEAATSSISFYSDIDGDSLKEKIRYFLDNEVIKKGIIKPSGQPMIYDPDQEIFSEVVHNVQNATTSVFSYYDSSYQGASESLAQPIDVSLVRLIKIYLVIDENLEEAPKPLILTTQVSLRNLKDNL